MATATAPWLAAETSIRTAVIVGEGAASVAAAILRDGGPPPLFEDTGIAVLGTAKPPGGLEGELPGTLPDGWADLVVMRRAWGGVRDVEPAVDEAHRLLRSTGRVVLGDLDVGDLAGRRDYPLAMLGAFVPSALETLAVSSVPGAILAVEVTRAGFADVRQGLVDEVWGSYDRSEDAVAAAAVRRFGDDLAAAVAGASEVVGRRLPPFVDREPWSVVTGTKR